MTSTISTSARAGALVRNDYGALSLNEHLSESQRNEVKVLLTQAIAHSDGPQETYFTSSGRELECINHDIYDVEIFRGRVKGLIVQERWFWRDKRKSRTRASKEYFLVRKEGRRIRVESLESRTCVKRARNAAALGDLVRHYLGEKALPCKAPAVQVETAYKVLAQQPDGSLESAFDGSAYKVGVWRSERAEEGHGGGFYCYLDAETAVRNTQAGATFANAVSEGKNLVLCEVEISGREVWYNSGKMAVSRLRIVSVLRPVEMPVDACDD